MFEDQNNDGYWDLRSNSGKYLCVHFWGASVLESARNMTQYLEPGHLCVFMNTANVFVSKPANHDVKQDNESHA